MGRRLAGVVTVVFLVLITTTASGVAQETTSTDFARLVEQALGNESAVAELRKIESIDDVPVDLDAILSGDPSNQQSQLVTLQKVADDTGIPSADAANLRADAAEILSNPPFAVRRADNDDLFGRLMRAIGNLFSGEVASVWVLLLVIAGGIALLVPAITWLTHRGTALRRVKAGTMEAKHQEDLVLAATRAEEAGNFDEAVRLLFRSGTGELEDRGAVRNGETASTATIRRLLRRDSDQFLERFDEIAYGGDNAEHDDVTESRRSWTRLVEKWPRP